ncbi:GntR family transcriptional regulator [uncultured Litoreibacter sp.]|uniref:GntR family transcriptional regulator n=1 Tax=uncultured Litoreibacter sp. TaxID=1392394 RepID=UPI00262643D5|nr:GntR family transcriptional regulator [uncultured Litoreibacter sp.]
MTTNSRAPDSENTLYEAILEDIYSGTLKGGERLKVSELADRFGVSTSPIREVLRQMQGEGFVEIHQNRGATIKLADASTIQNIFEVLQLLEPYFVGWFADYAQPQMVEEMALIQEQIKATPVNDQLAFRKLDFEFHWSICKRHYNQVAAKTWRNLRTALNVHAADLRISPVRYQAILEDHDALLAAFKVNDAAQADAVIRKHIDGSFVQMSQQMRAIGL